MENEKMTTSTSHTHGSDTPPSVEANEEIRAHGKPWMYKKIGGFFPAYASPEFQVTFVAVVCFLCPGMYNALSGLGAGGLLDPYDVNRAAIALNSTFSVVAFFAGSIANTIGLRLCLGFGGIGYCIYATSILVYNHTQNAGFLIFAGALLGVCAGLLWTAQGAVMMAYPLEKQKGKFISIFWVIFNFGAVIGSLISLGQNINSTTNSVNDGTYIAFIVLMALGLVTACLLCNPHYVVRKDGSRVIMMKNPTWKTEIVGLFETMKTDWYIVFLFPLFLSSNWFYTYHFQAVNFAKFNIRTRALNGVLYWSAQMVGASIFGIALDYQKISRPLRAKLCLLVLAALTMVIWGGGYPFQKTYTRESTSAEDFVKLDWSDSGYIGPMFLYMFYGFYDAAFQTSCYWIMGALSNNARKLANFAGFYKGIQSAGGAISPSLDSNKVSYMAQFGVNWGLLLGSVLIAAPVVWLKVEDTTALEKDLKFSDETKAEVIATEPTPEIKH